MTTYLYFSNLFDLIDDLHFIYVGANLNSTSRFVSALAHFIGFNQIEYIIDCIYD